MVFHTNSLHFDTELRYILIIMYIKTPRSPFLYYTYSSILDLVL